MAERFKPRRPEPPVVDPNQVRDDIYNLETAAARCRVSKEQVIEWIKAGLRAFPLGESTHYRARDYVILEEWLLDFFRGRGVVTSGDATPDKKKAESKKPKVPKGVTRDEPLGPRPA